jgi:hypothetical protein
MYDARLANNSSVIDLPAPAVICQPASMGVVKINQQKPNTKIKKAGSRYRAAPLTLFPAGPKNGHIGRSNRYTTDQMRTDMCIDFS